MTRLGTYYKRYYKKTLRRIGKGMSMSKKD